MAKLTYRNSKPGDVDYLVKNMRQEDVDEIYAAGHTSIKEVLDMGLRRSDQLMTAVGSDDKPVFIGGTVPVTLTSNIGIVWLLGTNENHKYRRNLIKDSKRAILLFLDHYKRLENYVHIKNEISIRWIKALGFTLEEPFKHFTGEIFMKFYIERSDNV